MSASRTERLLNLLIALLGTRYGRSKEFLRENIQAYRDSPSEEAFERMFERDKGDLRAMGIPLETRRLPGAFEEDPGNVSYRIPKEKYQLPKIRFTAAEAAVLALAGRLWGRATLGGAASRAVRKIGMRVTDAGPEPASEPLLEPRISAREPGFEDLLEAVSTRRTVSFDYRGREDDQPRRRRVQPWGLGLKFNHWYFIGWDLDRQSRRTFRLSRVCSEVLLSEERFERPSDFSVTQALEGLATSPVQEARLLVRHGRGQGLRQRQADAGETPNCETPADWDAMTVHYSSWGDFAAEIAGYGPDVRLLSPADLRAEVARRLEAVVRVHQEPLPELPAWPGTSLTSRPKSTAQDRLRRLVDLVPFLVHHQGMHVDEVAAEFGITRRQLEADLSLLMVSGLPGGLHGDLMDVTWDDGYIYIADAEELSEAVRLSVDEASALLVGLEALSALPGLAADSAVRTAMSKISAAAGEAVGDLGSGAQATAEGLPGGGLSRIIGIRLSSPEQSQALELLQKAVRDHRQLKLEYLVPHRDEVTERTVDPLRVFSHNEAWYVQAWCHSAEAERIFRVDRIRSVALGGSIPVEAVERQHQAAGQDFPEQLFTPGEQDVEAVLLIDRSALWVADYYEAAESVDLSERKGRWTKLLRIRLGSPQWLPRLVAQGGGAIRLVEPAESVSTVVDWAREALVGYVEDDS